MLNLSAIQGGDQSVGLRGPSWPTWRTQSLSNLLTNAGHGKGRLSGSLTHGPYQEIRFKVGWSCHSLPLPSWKLTKPGSMKKGYHIYIYIYMYAYIYIYYCIWSCPVVSLHEANFWKPPDPARLAFETALTQSKGGWHGLTPNKTERPSEG